MYSLCVVVVAAIESRLPTTTERGTHVGRNRSIEHQLINQCRRFCEAAGLSAGAAVTTTESGERSVDRSPGAAWCAPAGGHSSPPDVVVIASYQ